MADHGDALARVRRRRRESCAEDRLHAEDGEEVRRRLHRVDAQRFVARFGQRQLRIPPRRRIVEDVRERAVVAEIHGRDALVRETLRVVYFPHHRQAVGIGVGQRAQHHAIEHAVDRRRRADAERQREQRRRGKSRRALQLTQPEPHVLQEGVHQTLRPR